MKGWPDEVNAQSPDTAAAVVVAGVLVSGSVGDGVPLETVEGSVLEPVSVLVEPASASPPASMVPTATPPLNATTRTTTNRTLLHPTELPLPIGAAYSRSPSNQPP